MKSRLRITQYTITPHSIFDENAVRVEIDDVGGGEFIRILANNEGATEIDPSDWPLVRDACQMLVEDIKSMEERITKGSES